MIKLVKVCSCLFLICVLAPVCIYAVDDAADTDEEEETVEQLLSFDFLLLFNQLTNQGIGLGAQFERQIIPHFSWRLYVGGAGFNTRYNDYYCAALTVSCFGHYYPFSRQLLGYYICAGDSVDFLGYIGNGGTPIDELNNHTISFEIQTGYKFTLPLTLIFDMFLGYKMAVSSSGEVFGTADSYLNRGIKYGLGFRKAL